MKKLVQQFHDHIAIDMKILEDYLNKADNKAEAVTSSMVIHAILLGYLRQLEIILNVND